MFLLIAQKIFQSFSNITFTMNYYDNHEENLSDANVTQQNERRALKFCTTRIVNNIRENNQRRQNYFDL